MKQVAKKVLAVMEAVRYVRKTGKNDHFDYSYASEADLLNVLRKPMIENGLILVPNVVEYQVNAGITSSLIEYTIIDADSGEEIKFKILGQGQDKGDKGAYKAATGANKYALMKLFQIATGDDPEKDESPDKPEPEKKPVKPTGSKRDDPETKAATIESIRTGLAYLNNNKIDNFNTAKRRLASMKKHLGIDTWETMAECSNKQLREYYAHLQKKSKEAPPLKAEDSPSGEAA